MLPIFNNRIQRIRHREQNRALVLQRRQLRDHSIPFDLPEERFIELYRLNREAARYLIDTIQPHLVEGVYNNSLPNFIKIFAALRFYATGSYQRDIVLSYNISLSQTSIQRCIMQVTAAIQQVIAPQEIVFPQNVREQNIRKVAFMEQFGFPGVIGCVDGTHVAILKPSQDGHNFLNKKGFYSLNVMIISDADLRILSVNANYPFCNHDSYIWRQTTIRNFLSQEFLGNRLRGSWLLSDSGYMLEPVLMTPFLNPQENSPEARYNFHLIRARNAIERCIGVLKCRFRVLLRERTARYTPEIVGSFVNTCGALHNLCIRFRVPVLDSLMVKNEPFVPNPVYQVPDIQRQATNIRNGIVNRYFR